MQRSPRKGWLEVICSAHWLVGASTAAVWAGKSDSYTWPLLFFYLWATTSCLLFFLLRSPLSCHLRSITTKEPADTTDRTLANSFLYGALSVPVLVVGDLLFAFWPVTVTVGFFFAIFRYFEPPALSLP